MRITRSMTGSKAGKIKETKPKAPTKKPDQPVKEPCITKVSHKSAAKKLKSKYTMGKKLTQNTPKRRRGKPIKRTGGGNQDKSKKKPNERLEDKGLGGFLNASKIPTLANKSN